MTPSDDRFHTLIDEAAGHRPDRPWYRYRVFTRGGRELVKGYAPSQELAARAAREAIRALEADRVERNRERGLRPRPWRDR